MHKFNLDYIADTDIKRYLNTEEQRTHVYQSSLKCLEFDEGVVLPSKDWTQDGLLPGGVVDKDGNYIEQSGFREGGSLPYTFSIEKVRQTDEVCIYLGFFQNCYGHGITDHIKKLWFLFTPECKRLQKEYSNIKFIYLVEKNQSLPSWQKEIFRLVGVQCDGWIQVTEVTSFRRIFLPMNSLVNDNEYRMFTPQFHDTIEKIKSNVVSLDHPIRKIYFTRTGIENYYRECGEKRVEDVFRKKGFTIYNPERLSVKQQIALLKDCDEFASTEGSCAHNSIFCKPQTKVIILRKADYANSYQIMINEFAKLDVTYIDVHHSSKADKQQPWHGPFYMYVSPYLCKYFRLWYRKPYWLDPLYWVYKRYKWSFYLKFKKMLCR